MNLKFDVNGLIPAIAQDYRTGEVLMCAYMNEESLRKTMETGNATYFSRSRNKLWVKGETSGHFQKVKEIRIDCDEDALLLKVEQIGAACHTKNYSCFYRTLRDFNNGELIWDNATTDGIPSQVLYDVYDTICDRVENPVEGSYTNYLFDKGIDKMLKKVGEETAETIIAAKNRDKNEVIYEVSDLLYHLSVMLLEQGVTWDEIFKELKVRHENKDLK